MITIVNQNQPQQVIINKDISTYSNNISSRYLYIFPSDGSENILAKGLYFNVEPVGTVINEMIYMENILINAIVIILFVKLIYCDKKLNLEKLILSLFSEKL